MPAYEVLVGATVQVFARVTVLAENEDEAADLADEQARREGPWTNCNGFEVSNVSRHIDEVSIDDIKEIG